MAEADSCLGMLCCKDVQFDEEWNSYGNNTEHYITASSDDIITRRGDRIYMYITFQRDFLPVFRDHITFEFRAASSNALAESFQRTNIIEFKEMEHEQQTGYGYKMDHISYREISVRIITPPDMPVGYWDLYMMTSSFDQSGRLEKLLKKDIVVLFNPWNKDEEIYLDDDEEVAKYVFSQSEIVCRKTSLFEYTKWKTNQFDQPVLKVALQLIQQMEIEDRASALSVVRYAATTLFDKDDGILIDNYNHSDNFPSAIKWDRTFVDAKTYGYFFNTSLPYLKTAYLPGQRHVVHFPIEIAGVFSTIMKTLGIPCRVVTGTNIIRDPCNVMEMMADQNCKRIDNGDELLTYHCWNEVWMSRKDLAPGYGGWQVVDCAPKRCSSDSYWSSIGPVPVQAIKQGHVWLPYNCKEIYTMINGPIVYGLKLGNNSNVYKIDNEQVGNKIVYCSDVGVLDITSEYKYPADSLERRLCHIMASKDTPFFQNHLFKRPAQALESNASVEPLEVQVKLPATVTFGDTIKGVIEMQLNSLESSEAVCQVYAKVITTKGIVTDTVYQKTMHLTLEPNTRLEKDFAWLSQDYETYIQHKHHLRFYVLYLLSHNQEFYTNFFDLHVEASDKSPSRDERPLPPPPPPTRRRQRRPVVYETITPTIATQTYV
ncbi:unnamed protein product [Clavelina lepadiformis]|uniref:Transglutaminase-like domain-containing protein n=1 Tax=Clavelina lepadiformis TaxID=159417 RepID=A0ABP0F4F0_CLALP